MLEINGAITIIILLILVTRFACRNKIGWKYLYALWLIVPARIVLPADKLKVKVSVMHWVDDVEKGINTIMQYSTFETSVYKLFMVLWGFVFCILVGQSLIRLVRFGRIVKQYSYTVESAYGAKIRIIQGKNRAFLFGNTIYVSRNVFENEERMKYVVLHEKMHKRQLDPLWDIVRMVLQCFFWYNPLIWIASRVSKRDSELSCDERVAKLLSEAECHQYCKSLLEIATGDVYVEPEPECGLGIQGGNLKERVKNLYMPKAEVQKWKWILAVWCVIVIFVTLPAESIMTKDSSEKQITVKDVELTEIV